MQVDQWRNKKFCRNYGSRLNQMESGISDLWDLSKSIRKDNIRIMSTPKGKERKKEQRLIQRNNTGNFPKPGVGIK